MSSRFVYCILAGGSDDSNMLPLGVKKNLLCGIKDIVLVLGDTDAVRMMLPEQDAKWVRFLKLSAEKDWSLAIRYSHPLKEADGPALYDIELVRVSRGTDTADVHPLKGTLVRSVKTEEVQSIGDLFG